MTVWFAGLVLVATLAAQTRKAPPWERSKHRGQDLYREHCIVCHDIDKEKTKKSGPSLHRLFKNDKLPLTGAKPTREYLTVKIKFGGQLMPPFVKKMSDAEIATVIAYIETK